MSKEERDIITVFTLLDMEDYYDELETVIENIKGRIPNFNSTYFLLWGEPFKDVDTFETEKEAKDFILKTIRGKRKFSEYGCYVLTLGEKYIEVV